MQKKEAQNHKNAFNFTSFNVSQELCFPIACNDICVSADNLKMGAVGIYKPMVKFYDLKCQVLKFERNLVCDPLKIKFLSDDGEKFVVLKSDKTLEFHLKSGLYEKISIPKQPKAIDYNTVLGEMYVGGSFDEIYRFNFQQGKFMKSIHIKANNIKCSNVNGIIGTSYDDMITFFDSRSREEIFKNKVNEEVTSLSLDKSGLKYSVGTDTGTVLEYDFRSDKPIRQFDLRNAITDMKYHEKNLIASCGSRLAVISENTQIEEIIPGFTINTFANAGGLIFIGGESNEIKGYCSTILGEFPSWFADLNPE